MPQAKEHVENAMMTKSFLPTLVFHSVFHGAWHEPFFAGSNLPLQHNAHHFYNVSLITYNRQTDSQFMVLRGGEAYPTATNAMV